MKSDYAIACEIQSYIKHRLSGLDEIEVWLAKNKNLGSYHKRVEQVLIEREVYADINTKLSEITGE
jgi:hypothetical protein